MKHLILYLLICTGLFAQVPYKSARFPAKTVLVTLSPTYLLQEDFDTGSGTTPPSGWTVPPGGTYSYSNTSPALPQGGNNYTISTGIDTFETWKAFTGQTECWGYFQFQIASLSITAAKVIFRLEDSGGVARCYVKINTDGTLQIWDSDFDAASTTGALSANTNYQIWVHFKSGVAIDVGFSTNGTRPTASPNYVQVTGIATSATVSRVGLMGNDVSVAQYWDHVIVNNAQIGNSP